MSRARGWLLILALSLAVSTAAGGIGFGADNREPMPANPTDVPWRAVGRVTFQFGMASGTLVGPNLVLTAKHAVFEPKTGKPYEQMLFTSAVVSPRGQRESSPVVKVWWQGERSAANGFPYDWALLVLKRSLGNVYGWMGVKSFDSTEDPTSFPVTYYGYGANPHELRLEWAACNAPYSSAGHFVLTRFPNLLVHDCACWPGSSGGALVVWSHGKPWIAGVHVAGTHDVWLTREMKEGQEGGFLKKYEPSRRFYEEYGNLSVAMGAPIEKLQGLPIPTHHSLEVENQTQGKVLAAVIYHSDNYNEERFEDYQAIGPGETATLVDARDGCTGSELYLHVHAEDGYTWGAPSYHTRVGKDPVIRPFFTVKLEAARRKLVLTRKTT